MLRLRYLIYGGGHPIASAEESLQGGRFLLHLFVTEVYLLYREVTNLHYARAYKNPIIRPTTEISLSLNAVEIEEFVSGLFIYFGLNPYLPSFLPIGSSYSTPTQCPAANPVGPENLTVPLLSRPASVDATLHREPTGISTAVVVSLSFSSRSIFGAKRPTLFLCLYAKTESWKISSIGRGEGCGVQITYLPCR